MTGLLIAAALVAAACLLIGWVHVLICMDGRPLPRPRLLDEPHGAHCRTAPPASVVGPGADVPLGYLPGQAEPAEDNPPMSREPVGASLAGPCDGVPRDAPVVDESAAAPAPAAAALARPVNGRNLGTMPRQTMPKRLVRADHPPWVTAGMPRLPLGPAGPLAIVRPFAHVVPMEEGR
jgi:hypothetical protein